MLNSVLSEAERTFAYDEREVHLKISAVTRSEWCSVVRIVIVRPRCSQEPGLRHLPFSCSLNSRSGESAQ